MVHIPLWGGELICSFISNNFRVVGLFQSRVILAFVSRLTNLPFPQRHIHASQKLCSLTLAVIGIGYD